MFYIRIPVVDLLQSVTIGVSGTVRENNTAQGVSLKIGTVRVKLSTLICWVKT